jgi:hypothetical protein
LTQQDLIKKYLKIWIYRLGRGWWEIDIRYYDDPATIVRTFSDPGNGAMLTLAMTTVQWVYTQACIEINLPAFDGMEESKIERVVIHELCHILVNEMREGEIHHEERVVTGLTKAFLWTEADIEKESHNELPVSTDPDPAGANI